MSYLRPLPTSFLMLQRLKLSRGKKKASKHSCFEAFYLVRLAGIEPTTPWFVAKYSIQLSYSRKVADSSTGAIIYIPCVWRYRDSAPQR